VGGFNRFSDEILKRTAEAYRRIRNTLRFLLANLHDFDPLTDSVAPAQRLSLDNWIITHTHHLQSEMIVAYDHYQFHTIYQKLHNFCINDLGGFYLDIIKDRQYTLPKNSVARRSAQTALYHVIHAMVRWIAPILSFTAETIWQHLPGPRENSVLLTEWYALPLSTHDPLACVYPEGNSLAYWEGIRRVRDEVNKVIEKQRIEGQLGASLEAEVHLYLTPGTALVTALRALQSELKFVFITSEASIHVGDIPERVPVITLDQQPLGIEVISTLGHKEKCVRCWHRCADIGQDPAHPTLCLRCVLNLPEGSGEARHYA
jgi:isoleucyl-tRNA synthetase